MSNTVGANDGKGAQASFWSYQVKMTIDRDGNLYIGDQSAVRKIAPDGVVTTLAGVANRGASRVDGRGAHARFKTISSIVIDHANNIYVLDDGVIRKIDRSGEVTTIEGSSQTSLGVPYAKSLTMHCAAASLAIDRSDNLYLGSYGAIRKIEPTGKVETLFDLDIDCSDNRGSDAGIISFPSAMAVDDEGNVYGFGARGLFKVTPSRELSLVLDRAFR